MHESNISILISRCTNTSSDIQYIALGINILKVILFLLYFIWLVVAFQIKEFHSRNLVYLYNINVLSLLYSTYGVAYLFLPSCLISLNWCRLQVFGSAIWVIAPGYFIAGLALYRLASVSILPFKHILSIGTILITLLLIWLVPTGLTLIAFFVFESDMYYNDTIKACVFDGDRDIKGFIYFVFVTFVLPNLIIFTAYISVVIKVKLSKMRAKPSRRAQNSLRLTVHLFIYIFMFEISLVAIIIQNYQIKYQPDAFPTAVIIWARLAKLFQHYCPLGLLYFHPIMLKQYKKIRAFFRNCYRIENRKNSSTEYVERIETRI